MVGPDVFWKTPLTKICPGSGVTAVQLHLRLRAERRLDVTVRRDRRRGDEVVCELRRAVDDEAVVGHRPASVDAAAELGARLEPGPDIQVTTVCCRTVCTSTSGLAPVTVTVSSIAPTRSSALTVAVNPVVSSTASRLNVLKPLSVNVTL